MKLLTIDESRAIWFREGWQFRLKSMDFPSQYQLCRRCSRTSAMKKARDFSRAALLFGFLLAASRAVLSQPRRQLRFLLRFQIDAAVDALD
jgi:hypothetical protein